MAEEKIVTVNLRRKLENIPKWRRQAAFGRIFRATMKNNDLKIGKNLNDKALSGATKVRVKITKDEKSTKAELVE